VLPKEFGANEEWPVRACKGDIRGNGGWNRFYGGDVHRTNRLRFFIPIVNAVLSESGQTRGRGREPS